MCGIAGIISNQPVDENLLNKMTDLLEHRGPEGRGVWLNGKKTVGFGQRRLAIIDLSDGGKQPRVSSDGLVSITFNGEIYNYKEIRTELEKIGYVFTSQSDTEVLLNSYLAWNKDCLSKLNGMFAFAVWDERNGELFAARDRLGERPFKYYYSNDKFIFASEIKSILLDKEVKREIDWQGVDLALGFRYVPSPLTGFKNIYKLPPGHYLSWKNCKVQLTKYWDAAPKKNFIATDYSTENLWKLFVDSVRLRMISDRPVGAFLSGGIDSTSVVAAIKEINRHPVETFVISLGGRSEDMKYAKIAADFFKTNHHELELKDLNLEAVLMELVEQYDEPFFDQSALPSLLINKAVKKHVTVVLSGDGGDELFGGYESYGFAKFLERYSSVPGGLKKLLEYILKNSPRNLYKIETINQGFYRAYSDYYSLWKTKLEKSKFYVTKNDLYSTKLKKSISFDVASEHMKEWFVGDGDIVNRAMLADIRSRLPDGYLAKVDFASLRNAVEVRPPFLDYRLVEISQSIPAKLKINRNGTKQIWKKIVKDKIPKEIISRPKAGFGVPLNKILLNELKSVVENILFSSSASIYQYFLKDTVEKIWKDHKNGSADYSNHIWSILILELWIRRYKAK